MTDVETLINHLEGATHRLIETAKAMGARELSAESHLPDWSRAHVLVHLARNSDGLRNLLLSARTGVPVRMYASPATRAADIDVGVLRPPEVIVEDVVESSTRFLVEARALPSDSWFTIVSFTSGGPNPASVTARQIVALRLEEVEVHHVDLATDYGFEQTPSSLSDELLQSFLARRARQGVQVTVQVTDRRTSNSERLSTSAAPVVTGSTSAALGWLAGRSETGVSSDLPDGKPPQLPPFA